MSIPPLHPRAQAIADRSPQALRPYTSPEWYLDQAQDELINKGWDNLTDVERQDYLDIVQERVNRMMPVALSPFRRSRDSRTGEHSWASTKKSNHWFQNGWRAMVAFLRASKTRLTAWWQNAPAA